MTLRLDVSQATLSLSARPLSNVGEDANLVLCRAPALVEERAQQRASGIRGSIGTKSLRLGR